MESYNYIINGKLIDVSPNKECWGGIYYLPSKHKISYGGPSGRYPSDYFGETVYGIQTVGTNGEIRISSTNGGPNIYLHEYK